VFSDLQKAAPSAFASAKRRYTIGCSGSSKNSQ